MNNAVRSPFKYVLATHSGSVIDQFQIPPAVAVVFLTYPGSYLSPITLANGFDTEQNARNLMTRSRNNMYSVTHLEGDIIQDLKVRMSNSYLTRFYLSKQGVQNTTKGPTGLPYGVFTLRNWQKYHSNFKAYRDTTAIRPVYASRSMTRLSKVIADLVTLLRPTKKTPLTLFVIGCRNTPFISLRNTLFKKKTFEKCREQNGRACARSGVPFPSNVTTHQMARKLYRERIQSAAEYKFFGFPS